MARGQEEERRWIGVTVTETLYDALMRVATEMGRHPTLVAEEALLDFVIAYANKKGENAPALVRLVAMNAENTQRMRAIDNVRALIHQQLVYPDEQVLDRINLLCADLGIDLKEIMKEVEGNSTIAAIMSIQGRIDPAEQILLDNIKIGEKVPVVDLYAIAKEKKITPAAMRRARINLGILTTHEGPGWFWHWPKDFSPQVYIQQLNGIGPVDQ